MNRSSVRFRSLAPFFFACVLTLAVLRDSVKRVLQQAELAANLFSRSSLYRPSLCFRRLPSFVSLSPAHRFAVSDHWLHFFVLRARCLAGNPEPFHRRLLSHGCSIRFFASGLEKSSLAPQSFRARHDSRPAANERSEIEPPNKTGAMHPAFSG